MDTPPVEPRDLEADKQTIDTLLTYLPRNKPDIPKINETSDQLLKELTNNSLDIMLNKPILKKLADSRKQKKMCHAIKAILDNKPATDEAYQQMSKRFETVIAQRTLEKTSPGVTTRKRKSGNQDEPELDNAFNTYMKIQKTFVNPSDRLIPSSWIKIPSTLREPIVFIDAPDEKSAAELKSKIEYHKIQLNLTAEITSLKHKGDKVIVKLTNAVQEGKFKDEMRTLVEGVNIYTPSQRDPMIQLYKIPKLTKVDELINDLKKFNNFNADDKIIFHRSYDNNFGNTKNVILRVSPAIRQELENKRGILLYKCTTIKAVDYFGILRCTRCLQYSHLKSSCASQSVCKHCAEHHNSDDCPNKLNSTKYKCASCDKAGHRAFDLRECEEYLRQLSHAASITNYVYTYIIQD